MLSCQWLSCLPSCRHAPQSCLVPYRDGASECKGLSLPPGLQVYAVYFKCNRNLIREMPNVKDYVREIYQLPGKQQPFAFSRAHA